MNIINIFNILHMLHIINTFAQKCLIHVMSNKWTSRHSKHRPSGPWRWGTCRRLRSAFAAPVQRPPPVQTSCSSRGSQSSLFGPRNPPCMTPPSALPSLHWVGGQQSASLSRRCSLDSPPPARKTLADTVRENEKKWKLQNFKQCLAES